MANAHFRTNFSKNLNVSFSFDPATLTCLNCGGGAHKVVGSSVGGGCSAGAYILSDQAFPPILPDPTGTGCMAIIRVEGGSLQELANVFLETFRGSLFGVGSVVLLSSASHLAETGTAAYAEDFVRAARLLSGGLGAGTLVRHGLPLLLGGTTSHALLRSLFEVGSWLGSLEPKGENFPSETFNLMLNKLSEGGEGRFLNDWEGRLKLPVQLTSFEKKVWASGGYKIPEKCAKITITLEEELLHALIKEIRGNYSIPLGEYPPIDRGEIIPPTVISCKYSFILVGASHSARLLKALEMEGHTGTVVSMPSYGPNKGTVERATAELEEALKNAPQAAVIFQMLDNAAYYAKTEESSLIPARRSPAGGFHLDGDLVVAPKELFSSSLKVCEPLFQAAEKAAMAVLLSPMPRYWTQGCCDDVEHAPNRAEANFEEYLFSGLDGLRRHCKDFLFLHRYKNTKVLNSGQLLTEADSGASTMDEAIDLLRDEWGPDPVHPGDQCYLQMAKKLVVRFKESGETAAPSQASAGTAGGPASKRARWLEEPETGSVQLNPQRPHTPYWRGARGGGQPARRGYSGRRYLGKGGAYPRKKF